MLYKEILPTGPLSRYIKCFWILESDEVPDGAVRDKILPDGCMELIFHYGDLFREYRNGHSGLQPRSFLYGQLRHFIEIGPTRRTGIIAVRFFPYGARPFLQLPVSELSSKAIGIQDVFGNPGRDLEEKIMNAQSNGQRLCLLQDFLLQRLKKHEDDDLAVQSSVTRVLRSQGTVKVEELACAFNMSSRSLERRFTSAVGMSPKLLARIIRFQNVFRLLQSGHINSLTALAYEGGYYDQAHFIRDFKDFSGVNPKTYFAESHLLGDHFTDKS